MTLKRRWTSQLFLDHLEEAFAAGRVAAERLNLRVYAAIVVRLEPTELAPETAMPVLCVGRMLNPDGPIPEWYDEVTIEAYAFAKAMTAMVREADTPAFPPRQGEPSHAGGVEYTPEAVYIGVSGADDDKDDYTIARTIGAVMAHAICPLRGTQTKQP